MSILLDAITREKQQQVGSLPDAVFTPRVNPPKPNTYALSIKGILVVGGMLATVGAAWVMVQVLVQAKTSVSQEEKVLQPLGKPVTELVPNATDAKAVNINAVNTHVVSTSPANLSSEHLSSKQLSSQRPEQEGQALVSSDNSAQIQLAGKVALPVARVYGQGRDYDPQSTEFNDGISYRQAGLSNEFGAIDEDLLQGLSDKEKDYAQHGNQYEQNVSDDKLWEIEPETSEEPIILGANSNARGRAELAALRLQVDEAAKKVNFSQTRDAYASRSSDSYADNSPVYLGSESAEQRQRNGKVSTQSSQAANLQTKENKLLAAFELALKDVEYEKSANRNVTKPALDPIPSTKTQGDDFPKYGQLPASLQLQVPEFSVVAHVYSSVAKNRWLNVDGVELQEGDKIQGKLTLVEIRPRDIVLEIEGTQFKVPAI